MAKLYPKNFINDNLEPKEETINFLLGYSRALSIINCNTKKLELFLN